MNSTDAIANRLLLPDQNPFETGIAMSHEQELVFEAFDHSRRSRRHYDHVSSLDGITILRGHRPQAQVFKCFEDLVEEDKAHNAFVEQSHAYFEEHVAEWREFCHELGLDSPSDSPECTLAFVRDALSETIFDEAWHERHEYDRNPKRNPDFTTRSGEPDMFHQQSWLVGLLRQVLRDRTVVEWQVDWYQRELVDESMDQVKRAGIKHHQEIALVSFAGAGSSASSWPKRFIKAFKSTTGKLTHGSRVWTWNKHPFILGATPEQLDMWRICAATQWYCSRKQKVRGRSLWVLKWLEKEGYQFPNLSNKKDDANWDPRKIIINGD